MGPTASGKTSVAVELAQSLPVEIISVDSALVYRNMNIGTAKPDAATLARAQHHLIDIRDPTEAYSAAAFRHDALRLRSFAGKRTRRRRGGVNAARQAMTIASAASASTLLSALISSSSRVT